ANMAIVSLVLGYLYSTIMQRPVQQYIPYLAVGFIAWNLLSSLITEGTQAFIASSAAMKEIPNPPPVYVYRVIWRNIIIFSYNLIVYVLVALVFQINPFPAIFLAIPGFILIVLNGTWVGLLLGLINAKFRDIHHLLNNIIRLVFFVTPVIWYPNLAQGVRGLFVTLNPFYYFIEILRAPLLGSYPGTQVWLVTFVITLLGWAITLPVYARWRAKIPFWV
ncbi:MAG: ABC transporter permease, partial [Planctomycetaceae bacterium]|nr:ABC transporter permease [Planctomycetaceae bacterium]